ncbi:copper homeostasis protein CutC [Gracilibacillus kekensis]|uniref:Copper homeostasis protein cutC homolog n=1 Tax=Gracilibacillus kekensis TaxID=1027249 RepID=A0A1M7QTT9_9BACI|nr:copper homeostasis protein CutC [Gracilibacillus kekensis]SHN34826.1 copper homeostasis protein [Gracilibacillus kekensis]
MIIEVIVQNEYEAINAEQLGVDRLELVSKIEKDGLTPSLKSVEEVTKNVSIPVQVMLRPHNNGFHYSDEDVSEMKKTVQKMLKIGVTNFVFGALTENHMINEALLEEIINISPDIRLTFHRAFDFVRDIDEAYEVLTKYANVVERILTSGGEHDCFSGKEALISLVKKSKKNNGPAIMPGSGLNGDNFRKFHHEVQAQEYHFGKGVRLYQSYEHLFNSKVLETLKNK